MNHLPRITTRSVVALAAAALLFAACGDDPAETQTSATDATEPDDGPSDEEIVDAPEPEEAPEEGDAPDADAPSSEPITRSVIAELEGPLDGAVVARIEQFARRGQVVELSFTVVNSDEGEGWGAGWGRFDNFLSGGLDSDDPAFSSIYGVTLVDGDNNARHRPLRSPDGECACSTGRIATAPSESIGLWATFPAPPEDVTSMTVQIPEFGSIELDLQ